MLETVHLTAINQELCKSGKKNPNFKKKKFHVLFQGQVVSILYFMSSAEAVIELDLILNQ